MRHYNIPIFTPEKACPFKCIYCNQQKITGKNEAFDIDEIDKIIALHLKTIPKENSFIQVAFFGGTFTANSLEEQELLLSKVQPYIKSKEINGIRISTRPDYITQKNLDLLKAYNVTNIELGAQSLVSSVLKASGRGHSVEDVEIVSKLINENGFILGLQMMIGLPSDNIEFAKQTAKKIIDFGAKETRIYPTLVIKETYLAKLFQNKKYEALTTNSAIEQSAEIFSIFEKANVKVLRVGLFPDENMLSNEVIAGPEMTHFKEKMMTYIWLKKLEKVFQSADKNKSIEIQVDKSQLNFAIGFQAANKKEILKHFKKVKFKTSDKLEINQFDVNYY